MTGEIREVNHLRGSRDNLGPGELMSFSNLRVMIVYDGAVRGESDYLLRYRRRAPGLELVLVPEHAASRQTSAVVQTTARQYSEHRGLPRVDVPEGRDANLLVLASARLRAY